MPWPSDFVTHEYQRDLGSPSHSRAARFIQRDDQVISVNLNAGTAEGEVTAAAVLSHSFNVNSVDGSFGIYSRGGTTTFETVTLSTNDPAYLAANLQVPAASTANDSEMPVLVQSELTPVVTGRR